MKLPRSLRFYVAASTFYAALVLFGLQFVYTLQLAETGLSAARGDTGEILASIEVVSFAIWIGISLIAGVVMHRLATALVDAKSVGERKDSELSAIFGLSAALAGPQEIAGIGEIFVNSLRPVLPPSTTTALIVYDDVVEAFQTVAADGPGAAALRGQTYSASALPATLRTRVIDHRHSLVIPDTVARGEEWERLTRELPAVGAARSLAALPLVSRERLVGALLLLSDTQGALTADAVQSAMIMGQYVAGSIHSALSVNEAEARAEREAFVNRIAQRARASLVPDQILRDTLDALARVLNVSRALVATGQSENELDVAYEWSAPGTPPPADAERRLSAARLAARLGRTIVVTDFRADGRFPAASNGPHSGHDVLAAAATPIRVGGRLAGALAFAQIDRPREWSATDVRLIEAVAQELRVAIATADAFESQRQAVTELERLNRAKSDFVSIVSHEFRTPLTGIQGFSEMMRTEDLTLAEMREYAGDIYKDAQRLNRMINEMLDLDKMESGRMPLHRDAVQLNELVREAAEQTSPNAPLHRIVTQLDPDAGSLFADRDKLTQVVVNLLNNAIKYSPKGGEVVVTTRREGDNVQLLVRDHGIGIPAEALQTIFERYGRVESRATRNIQGTGLGLPIVRQIVQLHGGRVWVESAVGEGSVFHVTIPRGDPPTSVPLAEVAS